MTTPRDKTYRSRTQADRYRGVCRRHGYTLVEVLTSTVILAVVFAGLGSALLIAGFALPTRQESDQSAVAAQEGIRDLLEDLRSAIAVDELDERSITLLKPEHCGCVPWVRYCWDSDQSTTLYKQVDDAEETPYLEQVLSFRLAYDIRTRQKIMPAYDEQLAATKLGGFDSSQGSADLALTTAYSFAEVAVPTMPEQTTGWQITKIGFVGRRASSTASGTLKVQLCRVDPFLQSPLNEVIGEVLLPAAQLPLTRGWIYVNVGNTPVLQPTDRVAVVFVPVSEPVGSLSKVNSVTSQVSLWQSPAGGSNWFQVLGVVVPLRVYGVVTVHHPEEVLTVPYLAGVQMIMETGGPGGQRLESATAVLNQPELSEGVFNQAGQSRWRMD